MRARLRRWGRYPRIIAICWRAAIATSLEYRVDLASGAALSVFWMSWAAAGAAVFFQFGADLAGWSYPEVLVVLGLFFAVSGLKQALFDPNLERMSEYVRRGTLDFLLTKPVDPQLLVTLRHLAIGNLLDPVLGIALAATGVALSGRGVTAAAVGAFLVMLAAALVLLYSAMLVLMALAVVLVGVQGLGSLAWGFVELSRFPVQFFRQPLQTVLVAVPVAFLTTFPAEALLGRLGPGLLLAGPLAALACLCAATLLWRRCLRGYTGASA